uniref:Endonuclease/exonuclease/phosphatase domain-containing protein n=1 Tax=Heliothis virescens TaxID=7102 RepID=A0A2A4JJP9_HELVI
MLNWKVLNENLGSDHLLIKISFSCISSVRMTSKRNFKVANWEKYTTSLNEYFAQISSSISNESVQSLYDTFIRVVNKATDEHIPILKTVTDPNKCFQPKPYWNPSLAKLVAQRRLALSQFRKNPTPYNLNILEGKTLEAKEAIRQAKTTDWQNYCSSIDEQTSSSEMWKRMRWAKGFGSPNTNSQVSSEQKVELLSNLTPRLCSFGDARVSFT